MLITFSFLITGVFFAGKWGVAAAGHTFAMWHFEGWQKSGDKPDVRTWKWVHEAMHWSVKLDPDNAEYSNDMGRLYEYSAIKMIEHDSQIQPLLAISLNFFRDTVRLRPSWALAWANLALLKHRTGAIDEEFSLAMDRAMQLGSAVPMVQQIIAEAGVANWRSLTVGMRRKVLLNIHNGLGSLRARQIVAMIAHYGMSAYFCIILPVSDHKQICKKSG
jgi:hypothetical protein